MLLYYFMLFMGLGLAALGIFNLLRAETTLRKWQGALGIIIGGFVLYMTLPYIPTFLQNNFTTSTGACILEVRDSGRSADVSIRMLETDEFFTFDEIPSLPAYGKEVPYYCEIEATDDQAWMISYQIFDIDTRQLITSSK